MQLDTLYHAIDANGVVGPVHLKSTLTPDCVSADVRQWCTRRGRLVAYSPADNREGEVCVLGSDQCMVRIVGHHNGLLADQLVPADLEEAHPRACCALTCLIVKAVGVRSDIHPGVHPQVKDVDPSCDRCRHCISSLAHRGTKAGKVVHLVATLHVS